MTVNGDDKTKGLDYRFQWDSSLSSEADENKNSRRLCGVSKDKIKQEEVQS